VAQAICDEAATRATDVILMGSSRETVGGPLIEAVVGAAPCHVAIMRGATENSRTDTLSPASFTRIFVPVDGSVAGRLAVEFAHRYAENTGAELTLAVLTEKRHSAAAQTATTAPAETESVDVRAPDEELERISIVFRASSVKPRVVRLGYDPFSSGVSSEVRSGSYDLIVLGAENRAIQHRLFFGYDIERLIRAARVPIVVVVPHVGRLT